MNYKNSKFWCKKDERKFVIYDENSLLQSSDEMRKIKYMSTFVAFNTTCMLISKIFDEQYWFVRHTWNKILIKKKLII